MRRETFQSISEKNVNVVDATPASRPAGQPASHNWRPAGEEDRPTGIGRAVARMRGEDATRDSTKILLLVRRKEVFHWE